MADFCKADARLMGVAVVPLDDPDLAQAELEFALANGLVFKAVAPTTLEVAAGDQTISRTLNELTWLSPEFTTNSRCPSSVSLTESCESTIGSRTEAGLQCR